MKKEFRKWLAVLLASAMVAQPGSAVMAAQETAAVQEETAAEAQKAAKAKEESEAQSEAQRKAEEQKAKEESEAQSEAQRKAEEQKAKEESEAQSEAQRKAEEQKAKEESEAQSEAQRKAEEQKAKEESEAQSEAQRKAEEQKAKEESEAQSEAQRKAEEQKAKEESEAQSEAQRKAEEQKAKEESEAQSEAQRKAEEQKASEEQKAREESEAQSEAQRKAEEQKAKEESEQKASEQEPQTQTSTEPNTEAPSEKETGPDETLTERQTEEKTEKSTEEKTEEPTEELTEEPTEESTEELTESRTEEAESETDEGYPVNDGEKITSSKLEQYLQEVLPYLIAAGDFTGQELSEEDVLTGDAADHALSSLKSTARAIANVRSSSDVAVVNLYADKKGRIDTKQLEEKFGGKTIDVSGRYVLINIVASSPDQNLDLSGYELVYGGNRVTYGDVSRVGYVLYSFTALQKDEFVDYHGTVTLSNGNGLKGTWLAPAGTVNVRSDLSGAVYADKVNVSEQSVLQKIVLIRGRDLAAEEAARRENAQESTELISDDDLTETEETETEETETEQETEETETEKDAEVLTEVPETEEGTGALTEMSETEEGTEVLTEVPETEEGTEVLTEVPETEEGAEALTELPETEVISEALTEEAETEASTERETELPETEMNSEFLVIEAETEAQEEPETEETERSTELAAEEEIFEEIINEAELRTWYSDAGAVLKVQMVDADTQEAITGGSIEVKASSPIYGADGTVSYEKGETVASHSWSQNDSDVHDIGENLKFGGSYYMEATVIPEGYLPAARTYFTIDAKGAAAFADSEEWDKNSQELKYQLYPEKTESAGVVLITVNGGEKSQNGAAFVVKNDNGEIIRDTSGSPMYYVTASKGKAVLEGLPAGTYYLSQIMAAAGYLVSADVKFAVEDEKQTEIQVTNLKIPDVSNTLTVSMQSMYGDTLLTAEKNHTFYTALFQDKNLTKKATEVKTIVQKKGKQISEEIVFAGLEAGKTYYLAETDEFGAALGNAVGQEAEIPYVSDFTQLTGETQKSVTSVKYQKMQMDETDSMTEGQAVQNPAGAGQAVLPEEKTVSLLHRYKEYPDGEFSYMAEIEITKKVLDTKKNAKAVTETFYVALFEDKEHKKMIGSPIAVPFQNQDTVSVTHTLKVTVGTAEFYAAETDGQGAVLTSGNGNYDFAIGFEDHATKDATGKLTVTCGQAARLTVTNTLSKAVVQMKVTDASGKLLTGAELVLKNAQGRVVSINGTVVFRSGEKVIEWKGVLPEGSYYLSEVNAPSGYLPTPDVPFEVETGKTTEVVMTNQKREGGSSMTVGMQIYEGEHLLYAQDTTTGTYAAEGRYTRYAALFSDAEHTRKVSNVQKITVSGFLGSTEFKNLVQGSTYYLAETDQYGQVLTSNDTRKIQYTKNGTSTISGASEQMVISEVYTSLPSGFRYTARLTLEKQVADSSGAPKAVTGSFYIGIFRTSDYSDTPTLVRLDLNNASSASVSKRILLSGTSDVTYYFAEVEQAGNRIANSADFSYTPSVDKPQITLTKSSDQKVTVVNKEKVSKVTLYLTKRVYEGTELKPVTATFYAGLFKDPQFTQLYANPIPMQLNNSSSVTLKLSLNLGTANEATVYVAEVDRNGKVVQSGKEFGYDIRVVNSTAAFTQENTEIQTILLNSVYGSVDESDWNNILSRPDNNVGGGTGGSGYGGGGYVSQNGEASAAGTGSVKTGDTTPWALYLILFAVSGAGLLFFGLRRRRTGK